MPMRIDTEDFCAFEIDITTERGRVVATMRSAADGWRLIYRTNNHGTVRIAGERVVWESALRRALAECKLHAGVPTHKARTD